MFSFFKKNKPTWLDGYPSYEAPHFGFGSALSVQQANENLDYLLANKQARIEALSQLLTQFDIDLTAGFADVAPEKIITQLYQWSGERWRDYKSATHTRQQWHTNNRCDEDLIYSVAMDTAIYFGDLVVKHKPAYSWGVDLDNGNSVMETYRRCVVQAPILRHNHLAVFDVEAMVAARVFNPDKPHWKWENHWLRTMDDHIAGRHMGEHLE